MKKMPTILSLVLMSSTVFAANCDKAALELAKVNLDSKAKTYSFDSSFILDSSLKKTAEDSKNDSISYNVVGSIYRTDYKINIVLDNSCSIKSITIQE
jgi:hypothetical protein